MSVPGINGSGAGLGQTRWNHVEVVVAVSRGPNYGSIFLALARAWRNDGSNDVIGNTPTISASLFHRVFDRASIANEFAEATGMSIWQALTSLLGDGCST